MSRRGEELWQAISVIAVICAVWIAMSLAVFLL
jgi:hypothetical protein